VVLQNFAQGRARWGEEEFQALKDACTAKVVFGGLSAKTDLEEVSSWCPEVDEPTRSRTRAPGGRRLSTTVSLRRVPCLTPAQVRAIPRERAVLFYREEPPVQLRLPGWWSRRHYAEQVRAARAAYEARGSVHP
jgi:type IV secretion system protein VirD4